LIATDAPDLGGGVGAEGGGGRLGGGGLGDTGGGGLQSIHPRAIERR
jgi:hypothetical protein